MIARTISLRPVGSAARLSVLWWNRERHLKHAVLRRIVELIAHHSMEHATTTTAADPAPELPKFSFLYELHQEGSHWLCAGRRADEERPKVFISPSYPPLLRKELVEAFGRFAQESECLEGAVPVLCLYDFSGQPGGGNDEESFFGNPELVELTQRFLKGLKGSNINSHTGPTHEPSAAVLLYSTLNRQNFSGYLQRAKKLAGFGEPFWYTWPRDEMLQLVQAKYLVEKLQSRGGGGGIASDRKVAPAGPDRATLGELEA